jgi:hypothetical protein
MRSMGRTANLVIQPGSVTLLAEYSLRSEYLNHVNSHLSEPQ